MKGSFPILPLENLGCGFPHLAAPVLSTLRQVWNHGVLLAIQDPIDREDKFLDRQRLQG